MPNLRPIRRGQLISPFGIGALVDFRGDESLMTAGLDEWPFAKEECPSDWLVREERLQARLDVTHFRLPPEHRDPGQGIQLANQYIPFVRFPRWHYCPRRGAMEQLPLFGGRMKCPCRPGLDCDSLPEARRPYLIPSRFIAICPRDISRTFHSWSGCTGAENGIEAIGSDSSPGDHQPVSRVSK